MAPTTPSDGGDPTPMGTPVPAGNCPRCMAFCWLILTAEPPEASMTWSYVVDGYFWPMNLRCCPCNYQHPADGRLYRIDPRRR